MFVEKYTPISWFLAFLGVKLFGKVLVEMVFGSIQGISRLGSQSKFQIFALFSRRHIRGPKRSSNIAAPY